jgi:hypothetical protein
LVDGFSQILYSLCGVIDFTVNRLSSFTFPAPFPAQSRRFSSDANIQKALGMITDLCGFISLTGTLWSFGDSCYNGISRSQEGFSNISVSFSLLCTVLLGFLSKKWRYLCLILSF